MRRKIKKYTDADEFKKNFKELADSKVEIYFDSENEKNLEEIVTVIREHSKKFKTILYLILKGQYNNDLYGHEDSKANITAMKFKGKSNSNFRIYCKEIFTNGKKVVMISALAKKVQKNNEDYKIKNIITSIKTYEYEFKE